MLRFYERHLSVSVLTVFLFIMESADECIRVFAKEKEAA
jgi:hypothetical protein